MRVPSIQTTVCVAVLVVTPSGWCAADTLPPCSVQFFVYSPSGERLNFRIDEVFVDSRGQSEVSGSHDHTGDVNLLEGQPGDHADRIIARHDRLFVPRVAAEGSGIRLDVHLSSVDDPGQATHATAAILLCQERVSVTLGSVDGDYSSFAVITGRLVHCDLSGVWWVRAVPMFVGRLESHSYEAPVDPATGTFRLAAGRGVRYILIAGKDKSPVATIAVDGVRGETVDAGDIDVGIACSEKTSP